MYTKKKNSKTENLKSHLHQRNEKQEQGTTNQDKFESIGMKLKGGGGGGGVSVDTWGSP